MKGVHRLHPDRARIDYLKTEIAIGITFAKIALRSENSEKMDRNRRYARMAYDTILRFTGDRGMLRITATDLAAMEAKLACLKAKLRQLGESFSN